MLVRKKTDFLEVIKRKGIFETLFHAINNTFGIIFSKINIFLFRTRGYDIDISVYLRGNNIFFQSKKNSIEIDKYCEIGYGVRMYSGFGGRIRINRNVGIFDSTIIDIHSELVIGENCLIAPFCYISDYDHVVKNAKIPIIEQGYVSKPISIGNNVWIGANAIILKGVTIGDNTIIGAGSVVTRDIPSNTLAAGNPARIIRKL